MSGGYPPSGLRVPELWAPPPRHLFQDGRQESPNQSAWGWPSRNLKSYPITNRLSCPSQSFKSYPITNRLPCPSWNFKSYPITNRLLCPSRNFKSYPITILYKVFHVKNISCILFLKCELNFWRIKEVGKCFQIRALEAVTNGRRAFLLCWPVFLQRRHPQLTAMISCFVEERTERMFRNPQSAAAIIARKKSRKAVSGGKSGG